jgi:hypothetical protein
MSQHADPSHRRKADIPDVLQQVYWFKCRKKSGRQGDCGHLKVHMLKVKSYNACTDMFRFTQEPSSGSILCLAKTTYMVFSVFVDIDEDRERSPAQQADMPP